MKNRSPALLRRHSGRMPFFDCGASRRATLKRNGSGTNVEIAHQSSFVGLVVDFPFSTEERPEGRPLSEKSWHKY